MSATNPESITDGSLIPRLGVIQTLFGNIEEKSIVFCLDVSGSMYLALKHVITQLKEELTKIATGNVRRFFNIVVFGTKLTSYWKEPLPCTLEEVQRAADWLDLAAQGSGVGLLPALITSFGNQGVEAVYLVTDGFPVEPSDFILNNIRPISSGRPIHVVMVTHQTPPEESAFHLLDNLSQLTYGSLRVVEICRHGSVERISPVYYSRGRGVLTRAKFKLGSGDQGADNITNQFKPTIATNGSDQEPLALRGDPLADLPLVAPFKAVDPCTGNESAFYHPYNHWYWPTCNGDSPVGSLSWAFGRYGPQHVWSKYRASRAFIDGRAHLDRWTDDANLAPSAGALLIGRRVLARNFEDGGCYYMGTIKSQLERSVFIVEFPPNPESKNATYQETHLADAIAYDDVAMHPIEPGDGVLVPQSGSGRFVPATVVRGREGRRRTIGITVEDETPLTVKQIIGRDKDPSVEPKSESEIQINAGQAVWIPAHLFENLTRGIVVHNQFPTVTSLGECASQSLQSCATHNATTPASFSYPYPPPKFLMSDCSPNISPGDLQFPYSCMPVYPRGSRDRPVGTVTATKAAIDEAAAKLLATKKPEESKVETVEVEDEQEVELESERLERPSRSYDLEDFEYLSNYRSPRHDVGVATDLSLFLTTEKGGSATVSDGRPPWRYWGHKAIRDVIDPPQFEPYDPPPVWGASLERGMSCYTGSAQVEWPTVNFGVIDPQARIPGNPLRMFDLIQHRSHTPSAPLRRDVAVGRDCLDPAEIERRREERRLHRVGRGYPELPRRDPPGHDHVTEVLHDFNKERIKAQVERDSSNLLNYQRRMLHRERIQESKLPTEHGYSAAMKFEEFKKQAARDLAFRGETGWMSSAVKTKQHSQMARRQMLASCVK